MSLFDQSALWKAVATGADLTAVLHDATITRPGGATFESSGIVRWKLGEAPVVEVFDPAGRGRGEPKAGPPGTLITTKPDAHWRVRGNVIAEPVGAFDEPFLIDEDGLTADHELARLDREPRLGSPCVVRFSPWELSLQRPRSDERLGLIGVLLRERRGIVQCLGAVPFDEFTIEHLKTPAFESTRKDRDFIRGEFNGGWPYWLRGRSNGRVECFVNGLQGSDFDRVCRAFDFALSVATGCHCHWLCAQESCDGSARARLWAPLEPWRARPSSFPPLPLFSGSGASFKNLIERCVAATLADPVLDEHLRLLYLCWDASSATLQLDGLTLTSVAEALAGVACERLLPDAERPTIPREHRDALVHALDASGEIKGNPLYARLRGYALSALGRPSAMETFRVLSRGEHALLVEEEVAAWNALRNLLAHGKFDAERHRGVQQMFRNVMLTANLVNKLVLALVGFAGDFVDYTTTDWKTRRFAWSPSGGAAT